MGNMASAKKSAWKFYVVACLPFALGLVLAVFLIAKAVTDILAFGRAMERIVVPGKETLVLSKAGKYTVFNEYESFFGGRVYVSDKDFISGIECRLKSIRTGGDLPLSPSKTNSKYSIGSMKGHSVFDFEVEEPGPYEFGCFFPPDTGDESGKKGVMAIGQGFGRETMKMILMIFGATAALILSAGATAAIIIVHFVRKKRPAAG